MLLLGSIILAVVVFFATATLEHAYEHGYENDPTTGKMPRWLTCTGKNGWIKSAIYGLVCGVANYVCALNGTPAIWGWLFLAAILAMLVHEAIVFCQDGDRWVEFGIFLIVWAMLVAALDVPVKVAAAPLTSAFWASVVRVLPLLALIFGLGMALYIVLNAKANTRQEEKGRKPIAGILAIILTAIALIWALAAQIDWASIKKTSAPVETPVAETTPIEKTAPSWNYRHNLVIDGDPLDQYDFGPNPLKEILQQMIADGEIEVPDDITNKTEQQLYELVKLSPEHVFDIFIDELAEDPAKGAGCIGYYDALMHTDLIGEFVSQYEDEPDRYMAAMNAALTEWDQNSEAYFATLYQFELALKHANEITVEYAAKGIKDQMYQWGFDPNGVPKVIVMESPNQSGWFLTFKFIIKGTTEVKVSYRINCDFQPCNCADVLGTTPQKNPNKTTKPSGGQSQGGNNGGQSQGGNNGGQSQGGDNGGQSQGGDITNPKDPTKGTNVGKNDTTGPGQNTNNGVGAQYSTKDDPQNSSRIDEYQDYKREVQELETQRVAGDNNTPTDSRSNTDAVDSNAEKGNGNVGGIDTKTPVHGEATVTDSSGKTQEIINSDTSGNKASSWDWNDLLNGGE